MISERELRRVAGRAGLGVGQAEHEYVVLCVLDGLSQTSPLSETFCLKGGTALRYAYFADWRHSVDLDFSVLSAYPAERLRSNLREWFERVEELHSVQVALRDFHKADGAARVRARFTGPLRHTNRLLLDVTLDEPVLLPPQRRLVVTDLFDEPRPYVLCYALEEILAEKLVVSYNVARHGIITTSGDCCVRKPTPSTGKQPVWCLVGNVSICDYQNPHRKPFYLQPCSKRRPLTGLRI